MDTLCCFIYLSMILILKSSYIVGNTNACECTGTVKMINSVRNLLLNDMFQLRLQNEMLASRVDTMELKLQEKSSLSVTPAPSGGSIFADTSRIQDVENTISNILSDVEQAIEASNNALRISNVMAKTVQSEKKKRLKTESVVKYRLKKQNESLEDFATRMDATFTGHVGTMSENMKRLEKYVSDTFTDIEKESKTVSENMQTLIHDRMETNLTDVQNELAIISQDVSRLTIDMGSVIDITLFDQKAVCDPNCSNDGVCFNDNTCRCKHLTEGKQCENFVCDSGCSKNGGECIGPETCKCPEGKYGPNCEHDCNCESNQICTSQDQEKKCIRGQSCIENTCQNGGTCIKTGSTQKCYCRAGFSGDDCSQSDGEQAYRLRFTKAPSDRSIKRGDSHTEECAVDAPPGENEQYNWTLNGVLIEAYDSSSGFGAYPGGVLQIDKFTDKLEGQYSCLVSTSTDTVEHMFSYRIVENCDVRIYPGPQSESKKINENALMICHVDSRAKDVRWKKDGVYIDFDKKPKFKKLVNNYLHIKDVGLSDAGTYTCEAEDQYGCYSYKEGKLTVIDVKPLNKYCGISVYDEAVLASTRIAKGRDARPGENPWHVTLYYGNNRPFCGGTLISQRYILTSAHCIKEFEEHIGLPWAPDNVKILLGTTNCYQPGDETIRTFKNYTLHPEYGKAVMFDSDLALIELDTPVEYTDKIRPICLEHKDYINRVFLEKSNSLSPVLGKVVGCGKKRDRGSTARILQEIHLPYVRRADCEDSLEGTGYNITDRMFCAGSNIGGSGDTCGGDAGGGYVMAASSRWVQTGIVSWAFGGCDKDKYYGVYTNVGEFYDWIDGIAKFSEEEVPDFLKQL